MELNYAIRQRHNNVKDMLQRFPRLVTSHTIIVVDHSASMKQGDVTGYR